MRHILAALAPLFVLFATSQAEEPPLQKTDLFVAGQDSYKLYRIPGIVVTRKGAVLAYCEARKSDSGDWGPIDVLLRRSTDGGRTWLPPQRLVHLEGDLPMNRLRASVDFTDAGYCISPSTAGCDPFSARIARPDSGGGFC